jgi:hypothetical protein
VVEGGEDMLKKKEQEFFKQLHLIMRHKKRMFQIRRKRERIIAALFQVVVEDAPVSILNLLYLVYGCFSSSSCSEDNADGKSLDAETDPTAAASCGPGQGAQTFFLSNTAYSLVLCTKKFYEWWTLENSMLLAKMLEDSIVTKTADARVMLGEVEELRANA